MAPYTIAAMNVTAAIEIFFDIVFL